MVPNGTYLTLRQWTILWPGILQIANLRYKYIYPLHATSYQDFTWAFCEKLRKYTSALLVMGRGGAQMSQAR